MEKKFRTPKHSQVVNVHINLVQHLYVSDYALVPKVKKSYGSDFDVDCKPLNKK